MKCKIQHIDKNRCEVEMTKKHKYTATVFKAFCDENRLHILELLNDKEKCACQLLEHLDIGQSSLSYHMKILIDSGVVKSRQEGKWTHYTISKKGCEVAAGLITTITGGGKS
ncbi:MAG TPA: metalloregulator ArsR/SmtB family transcription factor [Treponemataceae bacterium]|nr:metalloregulator ArsR/SmtB family transcription factor [Treponemataceae bacterium]